MKPGLISSIKAFIVASSLSVASAAAAFAATPGSTSTITYAPIALGPQATTSLSNLYVNPPMGAVTLGGIPFNLSNFVLLRPGQSVTIPSSVQNASAAYLLLNSGNTGTWSAGQTEGNVRLSFSNGTFQDTRLIVGSNIREWHPEGWTVNGLSSPTATNVWSGSGALIDMLTIAIAPTTATLTGVTVSNQAPYWLNMQLNGLTIADPAPATVAPSTADEDADEDDDDDSDHAAPSALETHRDSAQPEKRDEAKAEAEKHHGTAAPKAKPADDDRDGEGHKDTKQAQTEKPGDD